MENSFLYAQMIGACAMCLCVYAWQLRQSRNIVKLYVPISLLWCAQYFLLGAHQAMAISALGAIKDGSIGFQSKIKPKFIIIAFLITCWAVGIYQFQHWYDVLPLLAVTTFNVSLFNPDQREYIARAGIVTQILWMSYNFIVGSWMGFLCSNFVIISSILGMARHEEWILGRCHRTFLPSLMRSLFVFPNWRTYP